MMDGSPSRTPACSGGQMATLEPVTLGEHSVTTTDGFYLCDHGILTESSVVRWHVSRDFTAAAVFATENARAVVRDRIDVAPRDTLGSAFVPVVRLECFDDEPTAVGFVVDASEVSAKVVAIPPAFRTKTESIAKAERRAEVIVQLMVVGARDSTTAENIAGADVVTHSGGIEVKCDRYAPRRIFLQAFERRWSGYHRQGSRNGS